MRYKEPKDVPNYIKPFIRMSWQAYGLPQYDRLTGKIDRYEELIADGELLNENVGVFIDDWHNQLERLAQMKGNEFFVDEFLCDEQGVMVDYEKYYNSKRIVVADECDQAIELLRRVMDPEDTMFSVDKEGVGELERFIKDKNKHLRNLCNKRDAAALNIRTIKTMRR